MLLQNLGLPRLSPLQQMSLFPLLHSVAFIVYLQLQ